MLWIPICIWTGLSGGFDWTPVQGSRNSWLGVRNPPLSRRSTWWGVLVYCDPKSWLKDPERLNLPEGWVIAVGVHPKHAMDFGDYYFDRLSKLLDSPAVTALGEVGIDCSEEAKPFGIQQSTLKWVLALAWPYMPLLFHIRASGDSPQATDTLYREVLGLMQDNVPNTLQSIHLHCFNGDDATVKLWSDAYPGTYFGFSSMVKGFGDRQRLKAIPGNRLLLESDSPHLPDVAGSINYPAHLFRVAEEVARVRGQSPLDVLRAGIANGQSLSLRK
jgi:TatD DNase family protein